MKSAARDESQTLSGRLPQRVLHVMNGTGGGAALSTLALIATLKDRHGILSSAVCNNNGQLSERDAIRDAVEGRVLFTPLYWWNRKTRAKAWKRPFIEVLQNAKTGARVASSARVIEFARRHRAELIHSNTILTLEGPTAAKVLGLGHVWHLRELLGTLFTFPLEGQELGRYVSRRTSLVVANSEACAAPWRPLLPPHQLRVIHNGIELDDLVTLPRKASAPVIVGMIANLASRWKKHDVFLEACRAVKAQTPVEFRLYGAIPKPGADTWADAVAQRATQAGVKLMGFTPALDALREIDILVHTADQESFGRTLVEGMAAAIPVVTVRAGGALETVVDGETGIFCDVDDAGGIARAVAQLADAPDLRARLGVAGRRRAQDVFSMATCADAVVQVYREAAAQPLGSRLGRVLRAVDVFGAR